MMDQNSRVIFNQPTSLPSATVPLDKRGVVLGVTGGKKLPRRDVVIALVAVLFLVVAIFVVGRILTLKTNQNREVKLTWWGLGEDEEAVAPLIDDYKKIHPNVSVSFVKVSPQDYRERLINSFIKKQGPDIFEFHNTWLPMLVRYMSFNSADLSSSFYPVMVSDLKTKNGFAGVPLEYDGIALFVNQDIFRAYGLEYPKTWDDLRKDAMQLTVRDQNGGIRQSGVAMGTVSNIDYWQDILGLLALQNGVDVTNFNSPSGLSVLTFYTNFSKRDIVWDDTLPNSSVYFATGKLAMYFGKYRDAVQFAKDPSLHFQVVPLPQLPKTEGNSSVSYASYWVNGVNKDSSSVREAWDFLNFLSSREALTKLYENEVKIRGYGNLYPRSDMQNDLLSDPVAGPFVYQAGFARSWYLAGKTNDGASGINTQVAGPFAQAIDAINNSNTPDAVIKDLQSQLTLTLANYGLVRAPLPTK
jgi:multiple sugar transport system substrate-binding protein